jgi:hypothetical protein
MLKIEILEAQQEHCTTGSESTYNRKTRRSSSIGGNALLTH